MIRFVCGGDECALFLLLIYAFLTIFMRKGCPNKIFAYYSNRNSLCFLPHQSMQSSNQTLLYFVVTVSVSLNLIVFQILYLFHTDTNLFYLITKHTLLTLTFSFPHSSVNPYIIIPFEVFLEELLSYYSRSFFCQSPLLLSFFSSF